MEPDHSKSEDVRTTTETSPIDTEELRDRLKTLIQIGKSIKATSDAVDIQIVPPYFDEVRFKLAQVACQKYYSNLSLASSTGLLLLVQIESILVPLLKTGRSRTVPDLLDRYVGTALYIKKFYDTDFYKNSSAGWAAIKLVRSMHQRIHKLMHGQLTAHNSQNFNVDIGENIVWVNQYDMALTQFAFVGLFLIDPIRCGAFILTREELSNVAYYWRLISYYLGIEERFNLFVYCDDLNKQVEYMKLVLEHLKDLLDSSPRNNTGLRMAEGIMLAFEDFNTESSFNILDHWWAPTVSISGLKQLRPYTLYEAIIKLPLFNLYFKILFRNKWLLRIMNEMYKKKFDKFCSSRDQIKAKLEKKYEDLTYELED